LIEGIPRPAFALLIFRFGCCADRLATTFLGRRHLRLPTPPVCRKKATNASGRLRQFVAIDSAWSTQKLASLGNQQPLHKMIQ